MDIELVSILIMLCHDRMVSLVDARGLGERHLMCFPISGHWDGTVREELSDDCRSGFFVLC